MKANIPGGEEKEITSGEIRREFQLERMVLFSDAVFAIVITLMAIEIRMPEFEHKPSASEIRHHLIRLIPIIIAYMISFFFIGMLWYRHLRLFAFLKDYDAGLVIRNLVLLFFTGLFPFGVSLVSRPVNSIIPFVSYFIIIICCLAAQLVLKQYVFIKAPHLRINVPITDELKDLRFNKVLIGIFCIFLVLCVTTYSLIPVQELKYMALGWCFLLAVTVKITKKKMGVSKRISI